MVSGQPDQARLEKGLRSFTAFWAYQPAVDLRDCCFRVKVKKMAEDRGWQRDFLNQQIAPGKTRAPWTAPTTSLPRTWPTLNRCESGCWQPCGLRW